MARTLFFLEGLVVAAIAILLPFIVADFALAALAPLAFVILVPVAASAATRPLSRLRTALSAAFTTGGLPPDSEEAAESVRDFGAYLLRAIALGVLVALCAALPGLGKGGRAESWILMGAYLALYGVLAALGMKIIAIVITGLGAAAAEPLPGPTAEVMAAAFRGRHGVSAREWEVAASIAAGASYKETADRLCISLSTVKAHLSSVYRKTGTRDKMDLVLLMRREGC
jgi:DNA-binding CsgD family transcriptional regulator